MTDGDDPYDLERFVTAQDRVYATVLAELRAGAKHTLDLVRVPATARPWPQCDSAPIRDRLDRRGEDLSGASGVLGPRLHECAALLLAHQGRSATDVLGYPDDLKVRSSMTLFASAGADEVFGAVLDAFYDGEDPATVELLS